MLDAQKFFALGPFQDCPEKEKVEKNRKGSIRG